MMLLETSQETTQNIPANQKDGLKQQKNTFKIN